MLKWLVVWVSILWRHHSGAVEDTGDDEESRDGIESR